MCGICGKVNFDSHLIDRNLIQSMASVLNHRGPDAEGVYIKGKIGLGHKRLSIIDLSSVANQPMPNEDNSIWIVCNGEIYNFLELRKNLEQKGHSFRSRSDTEVILHLYEDTGIDCVKDLRGMFAFAIWDENKQRLILARDRIGKKPLTYAIKNGNLIFASELKSILKDPDFSREINTEALDLYLTYQYIPAPLTIFSEIKKLLPAHILIWEKGEVKIECYWKLSYNHKVRMSEQDYADNLLQLFTESVRIRMISDVPLGVFLSGGIDSSAVVAMMSRLSGKPIKTFSIGFKEGSFNELKYARKIAKLFNTEHHEYIVSPDALEILPKLAWHFNEPFGDSSAIPTYCISKITREEVTVALNGDGGDESFAGYDRYIANKIAHIYDLIPRYIRQNILASFIKKLPESTHKKDIIKRCKRFIMGNIFSKEARYAYWVSAFDKTLKDNLYSQELKNRLNESDPWNYIYNTYKQSDARDFLEATLFVDAMTYLPNDLLVKADIASMANSLEARSPFLDHKLMEFAASIPSNLKLKGLTSKYILKKAFSKILPREILYRKKAGFGVPVGSWLRKELKSYAYDLLLSQASLKRKYFKREAIKNLLDEHISGKFDHGHRLWSLINLELWHRIFVDNHGYSG